MYKSYSMELAGRTLTVDIDRVAKQANGAAFMHYGDTVVLSTATASDKPREGIDFFPLSVEYEEKMYAVGKIPGGFNKREGKASEHAILTSRVIDRPMRPLFPKDYRNDVTLNNMVMSVDPQCNPEVVAMLGSAIATCISDIPFDGPCAATQMGMIDGELIVNPTLDQKAVSDLSLTVASTREKVIMIEAGANEIPEARMIEAIYKAHEVNQEIIAFIDKDLGFNSYATVLGRGMADVASGALVVGFARGVLVVMTDGNILHTILNACAGFLQGLPSMVSAIGMYIFQCLLSFIVPSGSGQASVSMPILAPLSDLVGISRQTACIAFQLGDGISNILTPTSGYFMAGLALAKISWAKWCKWFLPLVGLQYLLGAIFVVVAQVIQLQ